MHVCVYAIYSLLMWKESEHKHMPTGWFHFVCVCMLKISAKYNIFFAFIVV